MSPDLLYCTTCYIPFSKEAHVTRINSPRSGSITNALIGKLPLAADFQHVIYLFYLLDKKETLLNHYLPVRRLVQQLFFARCGPAYHLSHCSLHKVNTTIPIDLLWKPCDCLLYNFGLILLQPCTVFFPPSILSLPVCLSVLLATFLPACLTVCLIRKTNEIIVATFITLSTTL